MSIPVVICDDSGFARKQLARALPSGWDVSVTFAAGGREALEAIRAGKGDVLFLDLTMPEMDGFAVLEAIRREDLPTLVIVVSGDIQPESQKRVQALGAVAFLKKPVDPQPLSQVLDEYGVLGVLTGVAAPVEARVEFADWCQEIANVAMGRAADLLAKATAETIELSIPKVNTLTGGELAMLIAGLTDEGNHASISQGFIGSGIAGEMLFAFYDTDAAALARLVSYQACDALPSEAELLLDITNVLAGAFLKGWSDLLDVKFSLGQPYLWVDQGPRQPLLDKAMISRRLLTIEIGYTLGNERVRCDQLLLITEGSIAALQDRAQMAMGAT